MAAEQPVIAAALAGIGPLIRRLGQTHTQLWRESIGPEVTGPQFTVLSLLREHGAMDQSTLGARAHLDKSTTAQLLERLRPRGLVTIGQDPGDQRRKLIGITPDGSAAAERLAGRVVCISDRMLSRLAPAERAQFLRLARLLVGDEEA